MGFFDIFRREGVNLEERDSGFLRYEDVFGDRPNTAAGVQVNTGTAVSLPTVFRCISLNACTIAAFPVDAFAKEEGGRREVAGPEWLERPNDEYDWMQFVQEVQTSLEIDGNAFILKVVTSAGRIIELWLLAPSMVTVERRNKRIAYIFNSGSERIVYTANEILHIKAFTHPRALRGLSPIQACMLTFGVGLASQEFAARFYGDGVHVSGVLEVPGTTILDPDKAEKLKESFARKHGGVSKSHALGVLSAGAKFVPMSINPEEAQFIETQRFGAEQQSWLFGVPPQYATSSEGTKGYVSGVTAGKMMWLQSGLLYRVVRLERSFSSLMPPGEYMKFNMSGFLRPDPTEQAGLIQAEIQNGVTTPDEWRALKDMPPHPNGLGARPWIPGNMTFMDSAGGTV